MKTNRTLFFVLIANLAALSVIFYIFPKVPLPFIFPSFLELQLSNLPAIIGGYALGPVAGAIIVVVRTLVKLLFMPTSTAFVGETVDVIIGVATVVTSSAIYKKMHTKKGAIIGMFAGMFAWTLIAVIANWTFVLDFYLEAFFGGNVDALLSMLEVIPGVNASNYMGKYLLYAILPFNLLLSGIVYGITLLYTKEYRALFIR